MYYEILNILHVCLLNLVFYQNHIVSGQEIHTNDNSTVLMYNCTVHCTEEKEKNTA